MASNGKRGEPRKTVDATASAETVLRAAYRKIEGQPVPDDLVRAAFGGKRRPERRS